MLVLYFPQIHAADNMRWVNNWHGVYFVLVELLELRAKKGQICANMSAPNLAVSSPHSTCHTTTCLHEADVETCIDWTERWKVNQ